MAIFIGLIGIIFWDSNDNGKQDGAERPIAGVTVNLYSNDNLIPDPGGADGPPIQTVTTNAQGEFSFTSVARGYYYYEVESPNGFNSFSSIQVADPLGNTVNDQGLSSIVMVDSAGLAFVRGLVIDNFMTGDPDFYGYQYYEDPIGWRTPSVIVGDPAAIMGTERDVVDVSIQPGGHQLITLLIGPQHDGPGGQFALSSPSGTVPIATVVWDGVGTPAGGLGGIDLTRGGFDDLLLQEFFETDQTATLTITLKDTSGNTASTDATLSNLPGGDRWPRGDLIQIPLSLFEPTVDITSIVSITSSLTGPPAVDLTLGSITTGHAVQGLSVGLVRRKQPKSKDKRCDNNCRK